MTFFKVSVLSKKKVEAHFLKYVSCLEYKIDDANVSKISMTMMRDEYFSEEQTQEFEKNLKISSFHYSQLTDLMQFSASVLKLQQFSALVLKLQCPNYCSSISFN